MAYYFSTARISYAWCVYEFFAFHLIPFGSSLTWNIQQYCFSILSNWFCPSIIEINRYSRLIQYYAHPTYTNTHGLHKYDSQNTARMESNNKSTNANKLLVTRYLFELSWNWRECRSTPRAHTTEKEGERQISVHRTCCCDKRQRKNALFWHR